ncbi:MAG: sulfurtransferase TusA family protein [Anaerolineae bacterium]|nr:sulfurtransferase TusA family protein [Anaerolineae bacterium]
MTIVVDARGLACPQPVIRTRQAMQGAERVVILVDNDATVANVSRMAEKAGWRRVPNMYDIAEALLGAGKVVSL